MSDEAPVLVVLGMHRSGTSAVTGALAAMGASAGDPASLLDASPGNPRGYFERRDVVAANESMLARRVREQLGDELDDGAFDDPGTLDGFAWLLGAFLPADTGRQAGTGAVSDPAACLRALRREAPEAPALLLKDPRLCLTLPAWRPAASQWLVVLALREPAAVARSLAKRNGLRADTADALWRAHLRGALMHSRGLPRVAIDYDRLLAEPATTLDEVAGFLRGNAVALPADATERAAATIDPALRRSAGQDGPAHDEGATAAARAHRRLCAIAPAVPEPAPALPAPDALDLQRALRVPLLHRCRHQRVTIAELENARLQLHRLQRHPLTGPLIRLLRRLKRDPGLGRP